MGLEKVGHLAKTCEINELIGSDQVEEIAGKNRKRGENYKKK